VGDSLTVRENTSTSLNDVSSRLFVELLAIAVSSSLRRVAFFRFWVVDIN